MALYFVPQRHVLWTWFEARYEREVHPGEMVLVDDISKQPQSMYLLRPHIPEPKSCVFEHIYFAKPNSIVFFKSVYESRHAFGEILAIESPWRAVML